MFWVVLLLCGLLRFFKIRIIVMFVFSCCRMGLFRCLLVLLVFLVIMIKVVGVWLCCFLIVVKLVVFFIIWNGVFGLFSWLIRIGIRFI